MERNSNTEDNIYLRQVSQAEAVKRGFIPLQLTCNAFKCLFHLFRVILGLSACEVGATLPVNESFNVEPKLGDRRN